MTPDEHLERMRAQAFALIQLTAAQGCRRRDETSDAMTVIEGQLRVLREMGFVPSHESEDDG